MSAAAGPAQVERGAADEVGGHRGRGRAPRRPPAAAAPGADQPASLNEEIWDYASRSVRSRVCKSISNIVLEARFMLPEAEYAYVQTAAQASKRMSSEVVEVTFESCTEIHLSLSFIFPRI